MNRGKLIIWREKIPDVEKGAFGYISEHWGSEVKCFYLQQPDKERTKVGWKAESYAKVEVEQISSDILPQEFVERVITDNPNAIHLFFGGFRHKLKEYLDAYIKYSDTGKFMCIAEKPLISGFYFKKIAKKILYKIIAQKYNPYITAFLAMGGKGVRRFTEYGFNKYILYPFMYCPDINMPKEVHYQKMITIQDPVKFLYLGRFDYQYKGLDYLINVFNSINPSLNKNWTLTLVGGYGNQKDEIISWADSKENVFFGGTWEQHDIISKMSNFDICLVPSREDGWNLSPNYSIYAHVGMITSDEATSNEIIENSGSGLVYHYNDIETLKNNIEYTINNKDMVLQWKQSTLAFMDKISSETVGKYFIEIADYTYYNSSKKPLCPWLTKK